MVKPGIWRVGVESNLNLRFRFSPTHLDSVGPSLSGSSVQFRFNSNLLLRGMLLRTSSARPGCKGRKVQVFKVSKLLLCKWPTRSSPGEGLRGYGASRRFFQRLPKISTISGPKKWARMLPRPVQDERRQTHLPTYKKTEDWNKRQTHTKTAQTARKLVYGRHKALVEGFKKAIKLLGLKTEA